MEIFEELNKIWESTELQEANDNYASNAAKTALVKKWIGKVENDNYNAPAIKQEIKDIKARSILHHLNGDHSNNEDLANDVLIIAEDAETAKLAHKILHLLSYCYIKEDLENKLKELDVEFYYHPDYSDRPQPITLATLANGLVQHNKKLKDIALIDQDEETLDDLGHNNFRLNSIDN